MEHDRFCGSMMLFSSHSWTGSSYFNSSSLDIRYCCCQIPHQQSCGSIMKIIAFPSNVLCFKLCDSSDSPQSNLDLSPTIVWSSWCAIVHPFVQTYQSFQISITTPLFFKKNPEIYCCYFVLYSSLAQEFQVSIDSSNLSQWVQVSALFPTHQKG